MLATAGTAVAAFRTPAVMNLVSRGGFIAMGVSIAAMMGSGMVARSIPYQPGFGTKQLAWLAHCAVIGAVIAPMCLLGGPILTRAAWYTAGMVGGLSTVAVCAPSDQFLYMGGPLAMGLGKITDVVSGRSYILPFRNCLLCQSRLRLPPPNHCYGRWSLLGRRLRRSHPVRGLPPLRHPEDHPQGREASCRIRSASF